MSKVMIVGGGFAGATAARELAASGTHVLMVEASEELGGKVRSYGCKATDKCNNCGVCLANGLWDFVEKSDLIDIRLNTKLMDLRGEKGRFTAALKNGGAIDFENDISDVVVATGFERTTRENFNGFVEISESDPADKNTIITGSDIEYIMKERGETRLFDKAPERVAFIQCFGSRDKQENTQYCSRVCCAYSTRAAKVIKNYYPDCDITFYYMEMQQVQNGNYFDEIKGLGVHFVKCRPVKITAGSPAGVTFENPETGRREEADFDLIVLADGIRPADDAARVAEICGLGQTEAGFLKYPTGRQDGLPAGIYITGCAGGPAKIEEVYNDGIAVARRILFN